MSAAWDVTTEAEIAYRRELLMEATRPRATGGRTASVVRRAVRAAAGRRAARATRGARPGGRQRAAARTTPLPPTARGLGDFPAWR